MAKIVAEKYSNHSRNFIAFMMLWRLVIFSTQSSVAQLDSIFDGGSYRTFIVHLPTGYTPTMDYSLVFNLHGLNSNAAQQEAYSQFDQFADGHQMIVVYPNAISGSWSFINNSDVDFLSHLVDTIRAEHSCNDCLFFTGMSMGGFMTYKLACDLPQPITAIAVVAGNMNILKQMNCILANGLPVMHFHGTADQIVNYGGTFGIPTVETTIQWWVNENNCNSTPDITSIPDTHTDDGCTVEKYYYGKGSNESEVTFYKITDGGHTWPGAIPVPPLGTTNQDIIASELIAEFFTKFCASTTAVNSVETINSISLFPNPVNDILTINLPDQVFEISFYDYLGRVVLRKPYASGTSEMDCSGFPDGMYFLGIDNGVNTFFQRVIVKYGQ